MGGACVDVEGHTGLDGNFFLFLSEVDDAFATDDVVDFLGFGVDMDLEAFLRVEVAY